FRVCHQAVERALKLPDLGDGERNQQPAATKYGGEERDEYERGGGRSRQPGAALNQRDHRKKDVGDDRRPDEWANNVARAVHDVHGDQGEQDDDDTLGRRTPTRTHRWLRLSACLPHPNTSDRWRL